MVFVTLHLLVAPPQEPIHLFAHNDAHSERSHSQEQESMSTQAPRKLTEQQRPVSNRYGNLYLLAPAFPNINTSLIPSNRMICLSSVILRV